MCCGRSRSRPRKTRTRFKKVAPRQLNTLSIGDKPVEFLLCRTTYFGINYSINPWMDVNNQTNKDKVVEQWNSLESKIKELGAGIKYVKEIDGLPDMVFTANASLILKDGKVIISHFAHPERQGEEKYFAEWFVENGYKVQQTDISFEGAGDALYLGDTLIGGYGYRSDRSFYNQFDNIAVAKLVDPYFYHLDTCFCPLDGLDYMIYPGAFDSTSLLVIRSLGGSEIAVPEEEARLFACNAVRIGRHIILPAGCPRTIQLLQDKGYICHSLEMSEFIKSGGACKCLTLAL